MVKNVKYTKVYISVIWTTRIEFISYSGIILVARKKYAKPSELYLSVLRVFKTVNSTLIHHRSMIIWPIETNALTAVVSIMF